MENSMHQAAEQGNTLEVKRLLSIGANVNQRDNRGFSAMHLAVKLNKKEVVTLLLQQQETDLELVDNEHRTALWHAANNSLEDILEQLIAKHADVRTHDNEKRTPLHVLIEHALDPPKVVRMIRLLIAHGADPYSEDINNKTPLSIAQQLCETDIVLPRMILLELLSFNFRKRIIICCDGTKNDRETEQPLTNVTRILSCIDTAGSDVHNETRFDQITHYIDGIGTGTTPLGSAYDSAFGASISRKICEAYRIICSGYINSRDQIVLVGLSRGAYTVLCLANFIDDVGLLYPSWMNEELPELFKLWYTGEHTAVHLRQNGELSRLETLCIALEKQGRLRRHINIDALAAWDTVKSLRAPWRMPLPFRQPQVEPFYFINDCVPPGVRKAYQALALDEQRNDFQPLVWTSSIANQLKQCWFLGSHCDVGGGNTNNGLSNISLCWVMAQLHDKVEFSREAAWTTTADGTIVQANTTPDDDHNENIPRWATTISDILSHDSLSWLWRRRGSTSRLPGNPQRHTFNSYEKMHFSVQALRDIQNPERRNSIPSLQGLTFKENEGRRYWRCSRDGYKSEWRGNIKGKER